MSKTTTECKIIYDLQTEDLSIGFDAITDKCENPELALDIQQRMSKHFSICDNKNCMKSLEARANVGIQTIEGVYLK